MKLHSSLSFIFGHSWVAAVRAVEVVSFGGDGASSSSALTVAVWGVHPAFSDEALVVV